MEPRLVAGKEPGVRRALRWHSGRSPQCVDPSAGAERNNAGVYITLERQIKHGGTKGCAACFGNAKVHSPEWARFQDIVDNEAAQTAAASASEPNVEMHEQAAGGSAQSSSGGPVPALGRPAPEDANMEAAESSAGQHTSAKRERLMAGMPILHETDVDVNVDSAGH